MHTSVHVHNVHQHSLLANRPAKQNKTKNKLELAGKSCSTRIHNARSVRARERENEEGSGIDLHFIFIFILFEHCV